MVDDDESADDDADGNDNDDISPGCKCNQAEGWIHSILQCLRMRVGWECRQSPDFHYDYYHDDCDDHDYLHFVVFSVCNSSVNC